MVSPVSARKSLGADDSFEIPEMSYDWDIDNEGHYCRLSKSSSKGSSNPSPATSIDHVPAESETEPEPSPIVTRTAATVLQHAPTDPLLLNSPAPPRTSLSRSESAYPVLAGPPTATSDRDRDRVQPHAPNARSFQRVASVPNRSRESNTNVYFVF